MKIKIEHQNKIVSYTTPEGVQVTKKLKDLNKSNITFLKAVGYDFTDIEEVKKVKKYKAVEQPKIDEDGEE